LQSSHLGGERDLIVIVGAGEPHRLLVERGEADRIGEAVPRERKRVPIILQRERAARLARDAALDFPGSRCARSKKSASPSIQRASAPGAAVRSSSLTPAKRAPSSKMRRSPITTRRVRERISSMATSVAVSSGLMPAGSPIASAMIGFWFK
jgi:hypothetical protein